VVITEHRAPRAARRDLRADAVADYYMRRSGVSFAAAWKARESGRSQPGLEKSSLLKKMGIHTWIGLATFICLAAIIGVARATAGDPAPKAPAQQSALPEAPDCLAVEGKDIDMRITAVNATVHCYYGFYGGANMGERGDRLLLIE
jgi:hypothetical protein